MPPTLALHLLSASLGSAAKSGHGTAEAALPALGRRALTIVAAAPIGAAIYAWGAMVFGISLVHQSSTTAHWAVLMTALTVRLSPWLRSVSESGPAALTQGIVESAAACAGC